MVVKLPLVLNMYRFQLFMSRTKTMTDQGISSECL